MSGKKNVSEASWPDRDEAPEITREMLDQAALYDGEKLVRRGRPPVRNPRRQVTIRLPQDVLEKWKATGPGWQTRMADRLSDI
ncbi:hypothetical protein CEK62_07805 [Alcanivorax sp. N3-2A]|nr:hypothetical protein CEK62_07805 [Alcanivorax sp. N3-2A]